MKISEFRTLAAMLAAACSTISGCADDADDEMGDDGTLSSTTAFVMTTGTSAGSSTSSGATSSDSSTGAPATTDSPDGGGTEGSSESGEDTTGDSEDASPYPSLPETLSLRGCDDIDLGPLCTLVQDEASIVANCGGTVYTGDLHENGDFTWTTEAIVNGDGATVETTCEGRIVLGQFRLTCTQTTSATEEEEATETTCDATAARSILPGVGCMELPSEIEDFVLCAEGEDNGSATLSGGSCRVIQDGCNFQANCEDSLVIAGSVNATEISFRYVLPALADAETPEEGEPAFLAGADVNHRCSAALDGTSLVGSCEAGAAGRGGTNTSVCAVTGEVEPPASCDAISPAGAEQIFVLDSCRLLEEGDGNGTGIGEPLCAFRQNNCIWEVHCGQGDELIYSGRLEPGDTAAQWNLATGTPCELSFDDEGNPTGACTVPGEEPCQLGSREPEPGSDECPTLPDGTEFYSRGCGGGDPLDCRLAMQNGCDYMAICAFSDSNPSVIFAGETLYQDERARFEFAGLGDYACYVDQATEEEIASGDRDDSEWYGQCTTPEGGQCRDNYDPETGEGYRGLQIFFEARPVETEE